MHVGNAEDRGGNRIDVTFFREQTNLHRLWDTNLVESQKLSYSEYADFCAALIPKHNQTWILKSGSLSLTT